MWGQGVTTDKKVQIIFILNILLMMHPGLTCLNKLYTPIKTAYSAVQDTGQFNLVSEHFVLFCIYIRNTQFSVIFYILYGMYSFVDVQPSFCMICYELQFVLYVKNEQKKGK